MEAIYIHRDGIHERVQVLKQYSESDGGAVDIYIPSLKRERQTLPNRLQFGVDSEEAYRLKLQIKQLKSNLKSCNDEWANLTRIIKNRDGRWVDRMRELEKCIIE